MYSGFCLARTTRDGYRITMTHFGFAWWWQFWCGAMTLLWLLEGFALGRQMVMQLAQGFAWYAAYDGYRHGFDSCAERINRRLAC